MTMPPEESLKKKEGDWKRSVITAENWSEAAVESFIKYAISDGFYAYFHGHDNKVLVNYITVYCHADGIFDLSNVWQNVGEDHPGKILNEREYELNKQAERLEKYLNK